MLKSLPGTVLEATEAGGAEGRVRHHPGPCRTYNIVEGTGLIRNNQSSAQTTEKRKLKSVEQTNAKWRRTRNPCALGMSRFTEGRAWQK